MGDETKPPSKRKSRLWLVAAIAFGTLAAAGGIYAKVRGPSGRTTSLGGTLAAAPAPELPNADASWVNGAPVTLATAKGQVLLVEGWHPA